MLRDKYVVDANKIPPHNVSINIMGIVQLSNITYDVVSKTPYTITPNKNASNIGLFSLNIK